MTRRLPALELLAPMLLVVLVGLLSTQVSLANEQYFLSALISVGMVVAVYVFVGNSGVLSFGQISFVAVGGFASGVMTIPVESKSGVLPELFPLLRDHTLGTIPSLGLAALVGGALALLLGLPLMRLSGLAAGIDYFGVGQNQMHQTEMPEVVRHLIDEKCLAAWTVDPGVGQILLAEAPKLLWPQVR